jgi:deoxyribodipyrimidine photolyase
LPTNLHQMKLPTGPAGGQELLADFLERIDAYHQARDFPAIKGPSYLSTHLRFGTVSIRQLARAAHQRMLAGSRGAEVWLSELIWRDFYHQLLHHQPQVVDQAFRPAYDRIRWAHGKTADAHFAAWCAGRTGYPLVDAAMLQIKQTGYMHNRLRMLVASFLSKDLGWTGGAVKRTLPCTSTTSTSRPTTAAGNGPPAAAATRSRISASSTRSARAAGSTPKGASSAVTCRRWPSCPTP